MTLIKKQILLIEDDLIDQIAFTRMFDQKMSNFSYTIANSVKEAQILLSKNSYDVVVSDFNLADGTTFDLLKELINTPVIILTGNEDDVTVAKAKSELAAAACYIKDLDLDYLNKIPKTINSILNKKSLKIELPFEVRSEKKLNIKENISIQYDLSKINNIFDGNKKLIKETILVFTKHKKIELVELKKYIFEEQNCEKVKKIVHKMQSGFRVFGMNQLEETAGFIEKLALENLHGQCCNKVEIQFEKLRQETNKAIEILEIELTKY